MKYDLRVLVTGCPRSGTGTATKVLGCLGYTATHEAALSAQRYCSPEVMNAAESSCFGPLYLDELNGTTRVIHLVRHPLDCIASIIARGLLSTHAEFRTKIGMSIEDATDYPDGPGRFWLDWNALIHPKAHTRVKIEDGPRAIASAVKREWMNRVSRKIWVNKLQKKEPVHWDDFDKKLRDELKQRACEYGYAV